MAAEPSRNSGSSFSESPIKDGRRASRCHHLNVDRQWRNRDMLQTRSRMSRALQIGFVAIALLLAQLQCVAACASQFCGDGFKTEQVPPCHRHHDHSHDQTSGPCAQQITVPTATAPQTLHADAPILSVLSVVATMSSALPADTW